MPTWKSSPTVNLLIYLALVAIAGAAAWHTYRTVRARGQREYSYILKCTNPNCINYRAYEATYPEDKKPPFECPRCGSPAYPALKCRACGDIFASVESPSRHVPYVCPSCKTASAFPLKRWEIPAKKSPGIP